jgi:hypothetical protein
MKGITWARDSHGLFDYETRHPLKKQMKCETSQQLIRKARDNDMQIIPTCIDYKEAFSNQAQLLLTINKIRSKSLTNITFRRLILFGCPEDAQER